MKHFKYFIISFFLIIIMFSLSGCNSKDIAQNSYISGKDYQYMYHVLGTCPDMAESKDGYYFFSGYYLYYADKKTMKPVIMCNKPNCLHDKETDPTKVDNCDAFIKGSTTQFLAYYDGNLYAKSTIFSKNNENYELIKISTDGTNRKSVLKFDFDPHSIAIHRGKVYYTQSAYNKNQNSLYKVCEFDLNKSNAKPRDIYNGNLQQGNIQDLICYGNNLYFTEYSITNTATIIKNMRYDLITNKSSRLFTNNDEEQPDFTIYNNELYYKILKLDKDGKIKESKAYVCDLNGENKKESFNVDYIYNYLSDQHNLYIKDVNASPFARNKELQSLNIVDNTGKIIDSIKTAPIFKGPFNVVSGSNEHLFFKTFTDDKYKIFYVDKNQFGSRNIELKPFFEIDEKQMYPNILKKVK